MNWRLAGSLMKLREEVNAKWPNRSKQSDGAVGDTAHASRNSDHNPWIKDPPGPAVVSAIDITHDPRGGFDSYAFANWLRLARDPRIKYVISNRRIFAGSEGPSPWVWRPYSGVNPHDHHVHISVKSDKAHYDNTASWAVAAAVIAVEAPFPEKYPRTLRRGMGGEVVEMLQTKLTSHGYEVKVDGQFGAFTEIAVKSFQSSKKLHADGIVGPQTWKELLNA